MKTNLLNYADVFTCVLAFGCITTFLKKWVCYFCGDVISSAHCYLLLQLLDDVDIEEGKRDLITREIGKFREIMKVMTTSFTPYRVVDDVGHLHIVTLLIS
jgi:hypothetical protein